MPFTRPIVLAMSIAALAVAGCGGGSSNKGTAAATTSSSAPANSAGTSTGGTATDTAGSATANTGGGTPVSRTAFIVSANDSCRRLHTKILALSAKHLDAVQVYEKASAAERKALAELERLTPPSELAANWKEIVVTLQTLAKDSASYAADTKAKNQAQASSLASTYEPLKEKAIAISTHDGLTACAVVF